MKLTSLKGLFVSKGRPRKGAWIEIAYVRKVTWSGESPPQGGVD